MNLTNAIELNDEELNEKRISKEEAYEYAQNKMGVHLKEFDWNW